MERARISTLRPLTSTGATGPGLAALLCAGAATLVLDAVPVAAQEAPVPQDAPAAVQTPPPADDPAPKDTELTFSADRVDYDTRADVVTATGNVLMARGLDRLRADKVVWDRRTGRVEASGNVAVRGPAGDTAYGDTVELADTLRDGVVDNLLVVLEQGGRLAASRGTRGADGVIALDRAVYTPCPVTDADGCGTRPSWLIRAVSVRYDPVARRVRYQGARLELFGVPVLPLPGLAHGLGGDGGSGVLVPQLRLDRTNGLEVAVPYYLRLAQNRDLTVTPHVYTGAAPMLEGEYRAISGRAAYRVAGFATYSRYVTVSGADDSQAEFRGYLDATGAMRLDPRWSITGQARITTDRTFLRRYDLSRDDRLRSTISLEKNGTNDYFVMQGWAVQTLRPDDAQGQQPIALPLIDYRRYLDAPVIGGRVLLHANTLGIWRTAGQDTQRAFASARWDRRRILPGGQLFDLTAQVRADAYHADQTALTPVPAYRGRDGWRGRIIAAAAADLRWPLTGPWMGGAQTVTPRVQLVATPPIENDSIPNEDARAFDLDDGNIFSINRFAGYDRFEDGARIAYGVDWTWTRPGLVVDATLGQSWRLTSKPALFPDGTGLTDRTSDIVGRSSVAWGDIVRFTHRFRLDKDSLGIRRNEIDATVGGRQSYATIGYLRLNRDIDELAEDLADREEVRIGGRWAFRRFWSVFGSAIIDLTDREEDPGFTTDGFDPVRHRLGFAYDDDCLSLSVTWRRDYEATGDARRGNSFLFRVALRNLGI